ncbi:hypothetical protein EGH24_07675 [Halonotius terrestris]|uniref:Uncharacterized protein n=1 Tax=Halonotius terrestris TaxID=2487750 RepID=A0A8J8TCM7_9EURY|nr:hypothetical protein [Halonotius terrestris]TQQ81021.1 hypothetical protein EGH24_07675 [Halonotius terrestris]
MGSDDADDQPQEQGILGPDELDITDHPKVESIDEGRYVVSADGPDVDPDEQLEDPGFDDDAAELPSGQSASSPAEPQSTEEPPTAEQSASTQPPTESGDEDDEEPEESATSTEEEAESKEKTPPSGSGGGSETQSPPPTTDESKESAEPPAVELTQQTVSQFLAESLAKTEESYGFDATVNIEGDVKRGRMSSDDIAETLEGLLRWYAKQTTDEVEPEAALGIILAGSSLEVEYPVQSVYTMLKQYGLQPDDSISELLTAVRKEGSFTIPPSKNK